MQGRLSAVRRALTLALAATLLAVPAARAETFTVTGFGDTPTGQPCADTANCPSIRSALERAAALPGPDTVVVPAGDYALSSGELNADSDMSIVGAGAGATTIRGSASFRVLEVAAGFTVTVSHVTLRDGTATPQSGFFGGNVTNFGTLTLDHVRVTGGSGYSAGGVANRNGTMTIANSLIDANTAFNGGGDAGGILNFGGNNGPAATLVVRDTTIAFNQARLIGGISEYGNAGDSTTLQRVTVAYNSSGDRGGGAVQSEQPLHIGGSIVAANTSTSGGPNCGAGVVDDDGNAESGTDCGFQVGTADLRLADALTDGGGDTPVLPLGAGSQAIDGGGACTGSDQRDLARPQGEACDAGAYEVASGTRIDSGPSGTTNRTNPAFAFSSAPSNPATVTYECRLDGPAGQGGYVACASPKAYEGLTDGAYRFLVRAVNDAGTPIGAADVRAFRVDATPPPPPTIDAADAGTLSGTAEPNAAIEVLEGTAVVALTTAGTDGRWSVAVPSTGAHTYTVRATDAAGNVSSPSAPRTFGTAVVAQATPTPAPVATPTPVPGKTVVIAPVSGKVLVKLPGGKGFAEVDATQGIPLGSTVDTRAGVVALTAKTGQTATFRDGIFKVTQTGTTTDLTLTEALAKCGKRASAAAKKPKTRKLWGSGSGSFRTRGQYSAATVRGTEWLVQDSCAGTLTRVKKGVVSVTDNVKHKTILLKAGKQYLAKPRRG